MALKYNEKTGEFEQERSCSPPKSSPYNNSPKPKLGCLRSIIASLGWGFVANMVGGLITTMFFPDASDDALTIQVVIIFIVTAVITYITINKNSDR